MRLTEKSTNVLNYVRDNGNKISIAELAEALGVTARSVNANVTDLTKKELATRVKEKGEDDKDITYVVLTEAGIAYTPSED
jgi:DNA-binding MarR family transcriptional regulator